MLSFYKRKHGLTYQQIANDSGLSKGHVYDILNNNLMPGFDNAKKVAKAVGLKVKFTEVKS